MKTEAYLSDDRKYRYWLLRVWDESLPILCLIGVNPSTADEKENDPTIRKGIGFAKRLGFGGLLMLNVGAYRATDPKHWNKADDPIGPENEIEHLLAYIARFKPQCVIACWGKSIGRFVLRGEQIAAAISGIKCFGLNSDGTPKHPLMLSYSTPIMLFAAGWSRP